MKKLSRLKLHNSQEVLNDSEMKMIRGGGYENYDYLSVESSCSASGGYCGGICSTVSVPTSIWGSVHVYERECITLTTRNDGYALNCICGRPR